MSNGYGSDTGQFPYTAVVKIHTYDTDGHRSHATGFMVGANDVLTAAHVVTDINFESVERVVVMPAYEDGNAPFGEISALEWDWNPSHNLDGDRWVSRLEAASDYAVISLPDRVGDKTGWFEIDGSSRSGTMNISGYPYQTGSGEYIVTEEVTVKSYNASGFNESSEKYVFRTTSELHGSGTSGGPLWYEKDGTYFAAGLHVAGYRNRKTLVNLNNIDQKYLNIIHENDHYILDEGLDVSSIKPSIHFKFLRDYDENTFGATENWTNVGQADVNSDGITEYIYVNDVLQRWATIGVVDDKVFVDRNGAGGDTRVVGVYIDPLVEAGNVAQGSDQDSQKRFEYDLANQNISQVLGYRDYDADGNLDLYFALTDNSAYLRAVMHSDGNIQ